MGMSRLLPFLALVALGQCQTVVQQVCSTNTQMTSIEQGAGVVLGGLFDIRAMGINGSGCGKPLSDTMQLFEAARFAINYLNSYNGGNGYISGVKFGMDAYDTCFSPSNALNILQKLYPQTTSSNPYCVLSNRVIAGAVGSLTSLTTIPAAGLAGQLPVSLISPAATAPELSDKIKYPTFLRTVPSCVVFAKVVVELLQSLQWQNVLVIYTDEIYGRGGYEQLLKAMYNRGLCVTQALAVDTKGNKDSYKAALNAIGTMSSPIAVLMAPNSLTKVILQAVEETPSLASMQWILSDIDITNDVSSVRRVRGALAVAPRSPTVDEFKTYFTQLQANPGNNVGNPWFKDWFETTYGCSLAASNCQTPTAAQFVQSPWAVPTMKAVFAYAETIRTICQNSGGGLCPRLTSMTTTEFNTALFGLDFTIPPNFPVALRGQKIKFNANGDPDTSEYTVFNYNNRGGSFTFQEIGRYVSNVFTLDTAPQLYDQTRNVVLTPNPTATCAALGCENCVVPRDAVNFRYKTGDLVIASLVSAHDPGSAPYTCGTGRASQLASLVAAEWAVSQYKVNNPTKLQQVTLGSLLADVCPDATVAQGFLTDLLSGNNRLVDSSKNIIPYENIQAFVDQISSDQAEIVSPIISEYNIPEVLTSVTSSMDYHGGVTPYFTRAVPSDKVLFSAISSLLQRLGWKYVQVATHMSGEYRDMAETFTQVAAGYGICIVDTVDYFGDGMADPFNRTVTDLVSNNVTQIVVVFGDMMYFRGLLTAIQQRGLSGQLQLIAGTDYPSIIQGLETATTGAIMFDLELSANAAFSSYLQNLKLADITANPFLRELFEVTNQCTFDYAARGLYTRGCDSTHNFNNAYQGRAPYVIQSINAVADKLHELIAEVCTPSYTGLCSGFHSASDVGSRLSAKLADIPKSAGFGTKNGEGTTNVLFRVYNQGWTEFVQFNTESEALATVNTASLVGYQNKLSACTGACMDCQYMFQMHTSIYHAGDLIIAGAFGVSNSGPANLQPYICGDVRTTNGPQFTMAMLYALQQVNSGKAPVSVKGVRFGDLILDHCSNPGRANLMVSDLYAGFNDQMDVDNQDKILAWITDTNESANETVPILDSLSVATVSPSATSDGLMKYPTFFRTIQGDSGAVTALLKIVKALKFSYIQVVYSANAYGQNGMNLLTTVSQAEGICIINQIEFFSANASTVVAQLVEAQTDVVILFMDEMDTDVLLTSIANNAKAKSALLILMPKSYTKIVQRVGSQFTYPIISLQLQRFSLAAYNAYINSSPISNPFFAEYYMKLMGCSIAGGYSTYNTSCSIPLSQITSDADYVEDEYVLSTIDAVYSVVDALHRTVIEYCGSNYTKPCSSFLAATDKRQRFNRNLNNVNFMDDGMRSFRFLVREGATTYNILQSNSSGSYVQVGSYSGQSMDLSDPAMQKYKNVASDCTAPCLGCIMRGLDFSFTEGDIYIAGIFDVHDRFLSPFTCGKIKTLHGYLLLEAFHYALDKVNAKEGQFANILRGTRLGGVGLDACDSAVRGGYIVSNIHSGVVTLATEGNIVFPSKIDAYIGSYASTGSMYIARILTDLQIPQVSYGAGSQDLSDQRVYPYFYRTVPSDDDQVEVMLKFMDKLNIRYVQVLFEDNINGASSNRSFVERASKYNICVARSIPHPDIVIVNPEISSHIVSKLTENPAANTVVTFLRTDFINSVLVTIGNTEKAKNKFRFVGSSSWSDNQDAILGAESQSVGTFTVGLDADNVEDFERYVNAKNLANSKNNPWFEEYFQKILNCYISKTDPQGYPIPCPSTQVSLINSMRYQQESDVVYVINAVYAAAFAIHKTLMRECGDNYATVCQNYFSSSNRRNEIRDNLANVSFTDPVGKDFMFVNRSGVASYRFYAINSGFLGTTYAQIGSYNRSTEMVSLSTNMETTNSDCNRPDACAECPNIRNSGLRYVFHKSTLNMVPTIVAFFDIHKQGIDPFRCGEINVAGFLQLLTFFYTLEKSSGNKYRILAIDTCSNSLRVDQDLFGLLQGTGLCNSDFNLINANPISIKTIGGVITMGEPNTVAASRVLELPGVTYVSPDSLSIWLDDKQHLVRTIAPVSAMIKTLVAFMSKLDWSYLDVVYEDSSEGVDAFIRFSSYANLATIAGSNLMVTAGSTVSDVQNLLLRLNGRTGSNVVVLLGSYNFAKLVLTAANASSIADRYVWIFGGDWDLTSSALNELVPFGVELRFITIKRLRYTVDNFQDYVNGLTYSRVHDSNSGVSVPQEWFDEVYQMMFNCTLSSAVRPINVNKMMCNTSQLFSNLTLKQDMYTLNTIAATYAVVDGLNNCGPACSADFDSSTARASILSSVLNVQRSWSADLKIMPGTPAMLQFDKDNRWWDQGYVIKYIRAKRRADGSLEITELELFNGVFNPTDKQITDMKSAVGITSVCNQSASCTNEIEKPQEQVSKPFKPSEPRNYYYYHSNGDRQYEWPVWAIIIAILTSVGLVVDVILFLILIFAYPVKSGTSVLGYMTIIGIIGIYVINFAFFVNANEGTCGARRFLMGVVYMIAIAPLLIKAIDNWRFSRNSSEKLRYSGISASFVLFMAAIAVVLIQCIIPIIWLILVHPTATEFAPFANARHDNWWCDPPELYDTGLVQSFIFVMFIILVTAVFSAMSFDNDRNNFESRWILFSCIATAGCFLVWMIVSTSAEPSARDPAVTIGNLVNATFLLIAMPLRKSVLLCQHLRKKEKDEDASEVLNARNGHLNAYDESYDNAMLDLNTYDNQYGTKPSQY